MGSEKKKGKKQGARPQFRRNSQTRTDFKRDQRLVSGETEWEEDEQFSHGERILPPGEETRRKEGISHEQAISERSDDPSLAALPEGKVLEIKGEWSQVLVGGDTWPSRLRGKHKGLALNQRSILAVGDRVRVEMQEDDTGVIREIFPRENEIERKSFRQRISHVIAANVDRMVIVNSVASPPLWPGLIDRYLVSAFTRDLEPLVCLNKADLDEEREGPPCVEEYRALGYDAILVSAESGAGLDELKQRLESATSVFVGQSGVGKSTLLNAIEPSLDLRTGEVSEFSEKGRHITTTARLIPLSFGAFVVDTPGVRTFDPFDLDLAVVESAFPEIFETAPNCRYPDCSHSLEPGCAVLTAVEEGAILERRYRSFLSIVKGQETP